MKRETESLLPARIVLTCISVFSFFLSLSRVLLCDIFHVPAWPMWREMTSRMVLELV